MLLLQIFQVRKSKSSKAAEEVEVSDELHRLSLQFHVHQKMNLFFCQESSCCLYFGHFVFTERVSGQPSVVHRLKKHTAKWEYIDRKRVLADMLVRSEESLKVRDKSWCQLFERNIIHMESSVQEFQQVTIHTNIFYTKIESASQPYTASRSPH